MPSRKEEGEETRKKEEIIWAIQNENPEEKNNHIWDGEFQITRMPTELDWKQNNMIKRAHCTRIKKPFFSHLGEFYKKNILIFIVPFFFLNAAAEN